MSNRNQNKKIVSFLVAALLLVSFCIVALAVDNPVSLASAQPNFIDVSIEGETKLGVNETGTYQALVNSENSGVLTYQWSISPENYTVLASDGASCSLTFTSPTEEPYVLSVQVSDSVAGNSGSAFKTVYDPFTSPSLYLSGTGAPYSYLIETDGLGWYRAINGTDGSVSFTSTNRTLVEFNTLNALTSGKIITNNVKWDTDLIISQNISITENVNGVETIFSPIIFQNGFEYGTLYPWFNLGGSFGNIAPTVETSTVYSGIYAVNCTVLGSALAKHNLDVPKTVYVSGWFKFSDLPTNGKSLQFFNAYETGYTAAPEKLCFFTYLFNNSGTQTIVLSDTGFGWNEYSVTLDTSEWHYFEIKYVQSTTVGELEMWIDFTERIHVTGQNYPYEFNILKVGNYDGTETGLSVLIDDITVSNYRYYAGGTPP